MTVINKRLSEIRMYEKNPRKNDKAVKYVAESIKQFGFRVPIIIDKEGTIIAGHTRFKACVKLGIDEIPCIVADDLTPEQIKAYRLADNKVAEKAEWDFDMLESEIEEILDFNMEDFGFEMEDVEENGGEEGNTSPDNGFTYKEQYGVIVMCKDEEDQKEIYERLTEEGYECKVVAT